MSRASCRRLWSLSHPVWLCAFRPFFALSAFVSLMLILAVGGCGYTFQGSGSVLPSDVKKIYIPIVENSSTEPSLTTLLTESLRDRFERFGVITVVDSLEEADAVLRVRVIKTKKKSRASDSVTDVTQQLDTEVTLSAELQRLSGPILYRNPRFTVSRAYASSRDSVVSGSADFIEGNLSGNDLGGLDQREVARGQEQEALSTVSDLAAKQVYDEAVAPDF